MGAIDIGRDQAVPVDGEVKDNVTYWATLSALAANATLYASLLFGALYLAVIAPGWTVPPVPLNWLPAPALVTAFAAMVAVRRAEASTASGGSPDRLLLVAAGLGVATTLALVTGIVLIDDPTSHANLALRVALLAYCAVHAGVAGVLAGHALWRSRGGYVSAVRATDMRVTRAWTDYAAMVQVPAGALLLLLSAGAIS
jgi:cytochrome c oxidase subunit I+III